MAVVDLLQGDATGGMAASYAAEKFKEEVADILSWLSAVIFQLLGKQSMDGDVVNALWGGRPGRSKGVLAILEYLITADGAVRLQCPYCKKPVCSDRCLVVNALASEVYEKVARF